MLPRALWLSRLNPKKMPGIVRERVRDHWTRERLTLVVIGLVSFYVTYVSYRNLKSLLPFVMGDKKYDYELHLLDQALFWGHDPAIVLHTALGTDYRRALPLADLPVVPAAGAARGHRLADLVARDLLRLLVRLLAGGLLDPRHRVLLRAAHPRPGLRVPRALLQPGPHARPPT